MYSPYVRHYDIETVVKSLDAEFACIIYDSNKKQIHVARDQFMLDHYLLVEQIIMVYILHQKQKQ